MRKTKERIISGIMSVLMVITNVFPAITQIVDAEVYPNHQPSMDYTTVGTQPEEKVTGTDLDNFTITMQYGYIGEKLGDSLHMTDSSVQVPITINIEYRGDQSYAAEEISFSIEDLKDIVRYELFRGHMYYPSYIKYNIGAELKGSNSGIGDWYYHIENEVETDKNNLYVFTNKNATEGAFTSSVEFLFTLSESSFSDFISGYERTFTSALKVNDETKKSNDLFFKFSLTPEQYDITKIEAMQYSYETSSSDSSTYEVGGYKLNEYYIMRANIYIDTYSTYRDFATKYEQEKGSPESYGSVIFEVPQDVKIISINDEYNPYEVLYNEDYKKGGKVNYYTNFKPDPEEYLEISSGYSLLIAVPKANYSLGDTVDISATVEGVLMDENETFYDKEVTAVPIHDTFITVLPPGNFQAEKNIYPNRISMHSIEVYDGVEVYSDLIGYYENRYTDAVLTKTVIEDYLVSMATNAQETAGRSGVKPTIDEYHVTKATFMNIKNNNSTVDIYVLPYGKTEYELFGTYNIVAAENSTDMTIEFNRTDIQYVKFEINGDYMANTTSEENLSKIRLYAYFNPSKNYASGLGYDFYLYNFAKMNLYSSDGLSYYEDCFDCSVVLVPEVQPEASGSIFHDSTVNETVFLRSSAYSYFKLYGVDTEAELLEIYEYSTSVTYPSLLKIKEDSIMFKPSQYFKVKNTEWITEDYVPISEIPDFIDVSYEIIKNDNNTNTITYHFKTDSEHPFLTVKQSNASSYNEEFNGVNIKQLFSLDYDAYISLKVQGLLPESIKTTITTTVLKTNTNFEKFYWVKEKANYEASTPVPAIAGHTFEGVEKFVNVGEGFTKNDSFVGYGREYSYKLRLYGGQATVDNIVFYDNLEEAYGENEYWKGTFNGIDTTLLDYYYDNKDYSYIIYYSADKNQAFDLTASGWVKSTDWTGPLSDVKSIAVDLTNFKLLTGANIYITVNMIAPETGEIGVKAYNSYAVDYISYDATTGIKMEDIKALPSNIVKVALNEFSYVYNFEKEWIVEGLEDIILKPIESEDYSLGNLIAAISNKTHTITASGQGLSTTTFEAVADADGNIVIPVEYANYTTFIYKASIINSTYTFEYNVTDKVEPEKPEEVILNSAYDDVITLKKENGYAGSFVLSNPNMVFIEEDVEGWFTSATGSGLAITFNKETSAHSGQIVIYYKYGNNTYRSPFYSCNDLAGQTVEIPSIEFWIHFSGYNQPPYNNYYGFKIDSIINKDISTILGSAGATIPTWYEITELPLGVYPESDHFPHIYGNTVWHYSQTKGNENITVTKVNNYEYNVKVTNTAKFIPVIESTVEKDEYLYTIEKDWSVTDIKEVIVLDLVEDPDLSLEEQKTLRANKDFTITATSPVLGTKTFNATADNEGLITIPTEYQNYKTYKFNLESDGIEYTFNYNISGFYPNNKPDINVNLSNGETITLKKEDNWKTTYKTDNKNLGFIEADIDGWKNGNTPNGLAITFSEKCSGDWFYGRIVIYYNYDGKTYVSNTYGGSDLAGKTLEIPSTDFYIYWSATRTSTNYGFSIDNIENKEVTTVLGSTTSSLPTITPIELGTGSYPESPHNSIPVGTSMWHYTHSVSSDNITITKTNDFNYNVKIVNTGNLYPLMTSTIDTQTYTYNFEKNWNVEGYNDLILGPVESELLTIEEQIDILAYSYLDITASGEGLSDVSFEVTADENGKFTIPAEYVKYTNFKVEADGYNFIYTIGSEKGPDIPDNITLTSSKGDTITLSKENDWKTSITSKYNNLQFIEEDIENWEEGTANGLAITFSDECKSYSSTYGYLYIYYKYNNRTYRSAKYGATTIAGQTIKIPSQEFWLFWYGSTSSNNYYGFKIDKIEDASVTSVIGSSGLDIPFSTSTLIEVDWTECPESNHYPYNTGNTLWHYSKPASNNNISLNKTNDYEYTVNVVNTGRKTKSVVSSEIEIGNIEVSFYKNWGYSSDIITINVINESGYFAEFDYIEIWDVNEEYIEETVYCDSDLGLVVFDDVSYWTDYGYVAKVYLLDGTVKTIKVNEDRMVPVPVTYKIEVLNYGTSYNIELNEDNGWYTTLELPANAQLRVTEITKGNWKENEPFEGTIDEWYNFGSSFTNMPDNGIETEEVIVPDPEEIIDTGNMGFNIYLPFALLTGITGISLTTRKKKKK